MLLGDILTTVQEKLPIKIAVFDNGRLGLREIEQKTEGLPNIYTNLVNPDFGAMAKAMGLWGRMVDRAEDLERSVFDWLAEPGPALLHAKVEPMELVMPPFSQMKPAVGMAPLYAAKAVLQAAAATSGK